MSDDEDLATAFIIIAIAAKVKKNKKTRIRSKWVRDWILRRPEEGAFMKLQQNLATTDVDGYKNFLRMTMEDFNYLVEMISPSIKKQDTHLRSAISPAERLSVTLRFLASGDSYFSLEYLYVTSFW